MCQLFPRLWQKTFGKRIIAQQCPKFFSIYRFKFHHKPKKSTIAQGYPTQALQGWRNINEGNESADSSVKCNLLITLTNPKGMNKVVQKLLSGTLIVHFVALRNVVNPLTMDQHNFIWNHKRDNSPFSPYICSS